MEKNLKRSQLAKALGITNASISMAVNNGMLVSNDDKTIDIEKNVNKIWIEKQIAKGKTFDINRIFNSEKVNSNNENDIEPSIDTEKRNIASKKNKSLDELRDIELRIKKENLLKLQKTNRLNELEIEKKEGRLVPLDTIKSFFLFVIETFTKTYTQESKSLANIMVNRLGGEKKHMIEIQKDLGQKLEQIKEQSVKEVINGLDNIVDEYSEVRSRGERK